MPKAITTNGSTNGIAADSSTTVRMRGLRTRCQKTAGTTSAEIEQQHRQPPGGMSAPAPTGAGRPPPPRASGRGCSRRAGRALSTRWRWSRARSRPRAARGRSRRPTKSVQRGNRLRGPTAPPSARASGTSAGAVVAMRSSSVAITAARSWLDAAELSATPICNVISRNWLVAGVAGQGVGQPVDADRPGEDEHPARGQERGQHRPRDVAPDFQRARRRASPPPPWRRPARRSSPAG